MRDPGRSAGHVRVVGTLSPCKRWSSRTRVTVTTDSSASASPSTASPSTDNGARRRSISATPRRVRIYLLLLGSDWSVYTDRNAAEVAAELALCQRAQPRGIPVLGLCFGGQLVAASLGLRVAKAAIPEIGWRTLRSEDSSLCPDGPWFEYHFDRWHEEGDVRSFIANEAAPQGFVVGRTLALQFHPEVTPATVSQWLRAAPDEVAAAGGDIEAIEAETAVLSTDARERCHRLVDTFLAEIASRPALRDAPA